MTFALDVVKEFPFFTPEHAEIAETFFKKI